MPVSPVAGVPPLSTFAQFDRRMANFTPVYIAPGLTHQNFYRENGQMILAAMVALFLLIFVFLNATGIIGTSSIFRPL